MDRHILAYVLRGLMIALAVSIAAFELLSPKRRSQRRQRQQKNEEYERIMSKRRD